MLQGKKTATNVGVGVGILLQITARVPQEMSLAPAIVVVALLSIGAVCFIWGCMNYAEGKGHSPWLDLPELCSCLGLLVLVVLPDHHKDR